MAVSPTQLDAIETTGKARDYDSYRSYRAGFVSEELKATEELYSKIDSADCKDRVHNLSECRLYSWFARDIESNRVHVISNSCRLRWCPICSRGRTGYIIHNLTPWIRSLKVPRFMTLTLKHSNDSLSDQIAFLYKHFRTLRKHKWFSKYVCGGVWFFQVKLSKQSDQWHPHLHCIIHGNYLPKMGLSKLWDKITNGSKIVDVKMIRDAESTAQYVARYSARPAQLKDYPLELRVEIFCAMHGRRLAGSWGTAKGVSLCPPKCVDKSKFVRLGSWSQVIERRKIDADAKDIFDAWWKKDVLDPNVSMDYIDRELNQMPTIEFNESDQVCDPQYQFFR